MNGHGDFNNTHTARTIVKIFPSSLSGMRRYLGRSLAILALEDDTDVRARYLSFLSSEPAPETDWMAQLELSTAMSIVDHQVLLRGALRLRILVLIGSLRRQSCSRLLAYEGARIPHRLVCNVRFL